MSTLSRRIYLYVVLLCCHYAWPKEEDGAFCLSTPVSSKEGHFPIDPPGPYVPWVWDAVLSRDGSYVESTVVSRNACKFNKTMWRELIREHPQYADRLDNGLDSNILVPVDNNFDYARDNYKIPGELGIGLMGQRVYCVFVSSGKSVATMKSLLIRDVYAAELSTIQVRCPVPVPAIEWDSLRLERIFSDPSHFHLNDGAVAYPVCKLKHTQAANNNIIKKIDKKKNHKQKQRLRSVATAVMPLYKLSLCTATSRQNLEHLVEWLEYYLLLGVEHFYIYDTSIAAASPLRSLLQMYIARGVVTVVHWPYRSCAYKLASGRFIEYDNPMDRTRSSFFHPPRAIAHTAALASCFSRYKQYSEWMAHVDDDEFIVLNPAYQLPDGHRPQGLYDLVSRIASTEPLTSAVYFKPIMVTDCRHIKTAHNQTHHQSQSNILPRFGVWDGPRRGPKHEGKMIMRTEAIGMFFVHYITLQEEHTPQWNWDPHTMLLTQAALLHFKESSFITGDIFGSALPITELSLIVDCRSLHSNTSLYYSRYTKFVMKSLESKVYDSLSRAIEISVSEAAEHHRNSINVF